MAEDGITIERQLPLVGPASHKLCFISARQSGIVSLAIQTAVLVLSAALAVFLTIYVDERHLAYTSENRTLISNDTQTTTFDSKREIKTDEMQMKELLNITDSENSTNTNANQLSLNGSISQPDNSENNNSNTTVFPGYDYEADYADLIHLSTFVYIGMCVIWLISLLGLFASVKLEIVDFVIFNAIVLAVVMIYIVIHALFISIPFFYLHNMNWKVIVTVAAVMLGLFTSSLFCGFALALLVQWYRYIVYVNDSDQCQCMAFIVGMIKDNKPRREVTNDYSIPEATRHSRVPYGDDIAVQQFSRF